MSNRNKLALLALSAALAAAASGVAMAQASGNQAAPANAQAQAAQTMATPETVFNAWDKDKNKTLSLEEFRTGWTEIQMRQTLAKLHSNFVAMDANKSNALEANEFANLEVIKKAGAKAPMMSAFDTDKNGKLDFKEYVQMIGTMMRNK
jgi:Ca2+-binding EF-hand superfamily protein